MPGGLCAACSPSPFPSSLCRVCAPLCVWGVRALLSASTMGDISGQPEDGGRQSGRELLRPQHPAQPSLHPLQLASAPQPFLTAPALLTWLQKRCGRPRSGNTTPNCNPWMPQHSLWFPLILTTFLSKITLLNYVQSFIHGQERLVPSQTAT